MPLENVHLNSHPPAAQEFWGNAENGFVSSEWGDPSRNAETETPLKENEGTQEPPLLQCLYLRSPAGKGWRHVLTSLGVGGPHT